MGEVLQHPSRRNDRRVCMIIRTNATVRVPQYRFYHSGVGVRIQRVGTKTKRVPIRIKIRRR